MKSTTLGLAVLSFLATPQLCFAQADTVVTASGHAEMKVMRAVRKDGELTIQLRFETDYSGYSGEVLYEHIAAEDWDRTIFLTAGEATFGLVRDADGSVEAPEALRLTFNYDPAKNPRVGSWEGTFLAPPRDVTSVELTFPNVGPTGPFEIDDR